MYAEGSYADRYMLTDKASDMPIYVRYRTARQSTMTHGHRTVRDGTNSYFYCTYNVEMFKHIGLIYETIGEYNC